MMMLKEKFYMEKICGCLWSRDVAYPFLKVKNYKPSGKLVSVEGLFSWNAGLSGHGGDGRDNKA